jgi:hypothetical protein
MYPEAIAELQRAYALMPYDSEISYGLALAYAGAGMRDEAQSVLDRMSRPSSQSQFLPREAALLHARFGEKDKAFEVLEQAYANHYFAVTQLNIDPRFDLLHSDSRSLDLLRRLGLKQ